MREDDIQGNHQMTPDSIAMVMGYIVIRLVESQNQLTILDPAVGTANLLTTIINQLTAATHEKVAAIGIDNDESLLSVADINTTLQRSSVTLMHQDALGELQIPKLTWSYPICRLGIIHLMKRLQRLRHTLSPAIPTSIIYCWSKRCAM